MQTSTQTEISASIPDKLFFRIGDVADIVGVKPYVLRFWETEFPMVSPQKSATGQRVYRRSDVEHLLMVKHLLYKERYSIEGARKRLRELRKEGDLQSYKEDTLYGGRATLQLQQTIRQALGKVQELDRMLRRPVREIFKY